MKSRVGVIQVDPARHDNTHQASVLEYCYLPTRLSRVTTSTLEDPSCNLGFTINATSPVLGYLIHLGLWYHNSSLQEYLYLFSTSTSTVPVSKYPKYSRYLTRGSKLTRYWQD